MNTEDFSSFNKKNNNKNKSFLDPRTIKRLGQSRALFFIPLIIEIIIIVILFYNINKISSSNNENLENISKYNRLYDNHNSEQAALKTEHNRLSKDLKEIDTDVSEIKNKIDNLLSHMGKIKRDSYSLRNRRLLNEYSVILELDEILQIEKWTGKNVIFACYAETGAQSGKRFHDYCDLYNDTVTVIMTEDEEIIGGYTSLSWEGIGDKKDDKAFIFNMNKRRKFNVIKGKNAISCEYVDLPVFGQDIALSKDNYYTMFPRNYDSKDEETGKEYDLLENKSTLLRIKSIEVFVLGDVK